MSGKKHSDPDSEDLDLWDQVKKTAKPLKPSRRAAVKEEIEIAAAPKKIEKPNRSVKTVVLEKKPEAKAPPPLASFDRRMRSRVARGQIDIGARLDLHGMTLERARRRLEKFLYGAQDDGVGVALVITGKGRGKNLGDGEIGVLRREVPMWLSHPELRGLVIGYEEAAPSHGGSGALYVRIRRAR